MRFVNKFSVAVVGAFALLVSGVAGATIILTPSTPNMIAGIGYGPSNCEPSCVNTVFGNSSTLSLLYKADVGSADSGLYANSYATSFNSLSDASGGLLTF